MGEGNSRFSLTECPRARKKQAKLQQHGECILAVSSEVVGLFVSRSISYCVLSGDNLAIPIVTSSEGALAQVLPTRAELFSVVDLCPPPPFWSLVHESSNQELYCINIYRYM